MLNPTPREIASLTSTGRCVMLRPIEPQPVIGTASLLGHPHFANEYVPWKDGVPMLSIVCPFVFGDILPGVGTITAVRAVRLAELSEADAELAGFEYDDTAGAPHKDLPALKVMQRQWQTVFPGHPWETTWCWWIEVSNTKGEA